jgi:hypothetical protein
MMRVIEFIRGDGSSKRLSTKPNRPITPKHTENRIRPGDLLETRAAEYEDGSSDSD